MKVSAILKGRKDEMDRQTVYIRISEGQKRLYKALPLKVKSTDFKKGVVLASHPSHKSYNMKIKEEILYVERHGGFQKEDEDGPLFLDYCEELIRRWERLRRPETLRQYESELNKFRVFSTDTTLKGMTPALLRDYLEHCYRLGNKENTAWKTFKFIRKVIRTAVKEGTIKENPFNLFEMPKYRDPHKEWLTVKEIAKIEKLLTKPLPEEILFAATWFLIGCYAGIRFGDMQAFNKKKHIVNGRLVIYTGKTGEVVSMPLSDKLKGLFSSIEWKAVYYTNTHFNRLLKQIGSLAEIDTVLSAHLSRHTAAIRWAESGISMEVTAKLLGHQSLRTTSIYYKITNRRIDDELNKLG